MHPSQLMLLYCCYQPCFSSHVYTLLLQHSAKLCLLVRGWADPEPQLCVTASGLEGFRRSAVIAAKRRLPAKRANLCSGRMRVGVHAAA